MVEIRVRIQDGNEQIQMKCPACSVWGDVDKDQTEGLVSCICPNCKAHWTVEKGEYNLEIKVDI